MWHIFTECGECGGVWRVWHILRSVASVPDCGVVWRNVSECSGV